jgi:phosphatidylglycerol:prolipoprotein diacylglycerol transferase
VRLLRGRVSEDAAYSVATWGVVGGILGARLLHVADRWDFYSQHLEQILMIWTGGIAVWGAAVGGVLGGLIAALRRRDVPIGGAADAAAPGIGLGFAIGRIGDIINGEHHSTPCEGFGICVGYTNPATLGQGPGLPGWEGPVHLVVAYEMAWNLIWVALALLLRRPLGRAPEGRIFWVWMIWYAVARIGFGAMRIGDPIAQAGLRQDQFMGVLALIVAIPALILIQAGVMPRILGRLRRMAPA